MSEGGAVVNWKRGAWRVWVVVASAWCLWAVVYAFGYQPLETRSMMHEGCWLDLERTASMLGTPSERADELRACQDRAARLTPTWGAAVAQAPRETAGVLALIVAVPIAVWWVLRGVVALGLWIVRGFRAGAIAGAIVLVMAATSADAGVGLMQDPCIRAAIRTADERLQSVRETARSEFREPTAAELAAVGDGLRLFYTTGNTLECADVIPSEIVVTELDRETVRARLPLEDARVRTKCNGFGACGQFALGWASVPRAALERDGYVFMLTSKGTRLLSRIFIDGVGMLAEIGGDASVPTQ